MSSPATTTITMPSATSTSLVPAAAAADPDVEAGVAALVPLESQMDAASLTIVDYLSRNWGIDELAGARSLATARLDAPEPSDDEVVLARLVDPSATPPEGLEDLREPTTAVLATALHCDRSPLPDSFYDGLGTLVDRGGYGATHAGLAVGWMAELGCTSSELDAATEQVTARIASDLAGQDAGAVSDLAVEQSATLIYLDAADRVPAGWADAVRGAQRPDGGWGPGATTWHMTMLALWTLLGLESPGADAPMVTAAVS